jgi:hypothetical protein
MAHLTRDQVYVTSNENMTKTPVSTMTTIMRRITPPTIFTRPGMLFKVLQEHEGKGIIAGLLIRVADAIIIPGLQLQGALAEERPGK